MLSQKKVKLHTICKISSLIFKCASIANFALRSLKSCISSENTIILLHRKIKNKLDACLKFVSNIKLLNLDKTPFYLWIFIG